RDLRERHPQDGAVVPGARRLGGRGAERQLSRLAGHQLRRKMKTLLLGCKGQVGWELQRALAPLGELTACDFDTPGDLKADFADAASLAALVRRLRPQLIVNAAAHTAVD